MSLSPLKTEREMLVSYLDAQRNHVLGILDGLDEDSLRRPNMQSGWTCLGLLRHLALDVERFWFRCVIAGDPTTIESLSESGDPWEVGPDVPAESIFALYRQETEYSNDIISRSSMESAPEWWPEGLFGSWRVQDVRQIVLHVMTETACHAGHFDAVREFVDGRQWLVMPR